jgi:membrane protease YdiL (CAAX protease family)
LAHAYQGPLAVVTVVPIGILFTAYYLRTRRLWPVVVAHAFQDILALEILRHVSNSSPA